ncbi:glycoside hydrolase family 68 protein [Sphingomonas sp. Leaf343]|uniref:glycoside hydrolase family 68 protein n=1 Tax=Sphingomonas sp. Leaf343 TaxID=1736345 RepID=UPI0006F8E65F|nr:glycoside hydrolase family 68 protein [Sphingomonas sp. Leaf343]KQR87614.1 levansucrase [Sphingomonas sp. Leaf343]
MPEPLWTPTHWSAAAIAGIRDQADAALPVIGAADVAPVVPDHDVWDMWPIADADGRTVFVDGRSFWFFLATPRFADPDQRHDAARIRLTSHGADGWRDHGDTFAEGFTPGSREWSGSAVLAADGETLTMYFTASGRRGEPRSFEQRLFESTGRFVAAAAQTEGWSPPVESVATDRVTYAAADQTEAVDDRIKGFRDPGYFRDPADGAEYLLFVGSAGWLDDVHDGVIGAARREGDRWVLTPPLVEAIGTNSELERPHIVVVDGRYYLFWSTQAKRFAPDTAAAGITGLYAMVADRIGGPWRPVNGTGLVAGNPAAEPFQAYCWWVTGELDVISFVDFWGLEGRSPDTPDLRRRHFGGTAAPWFRLAIDGDRVSIA